MEKLKEYIKNKWPELYDVIWKSYQIPYGFIKYIVSFPKIYFRGNGWIDKNFIELKNMKDSYIGRRCFIICTGPSLNAQDLDKLNSEISFGMNSISKIYDKTSWRPTFYGIIDGQVYKHIQNDDIEYTEVAFIPESFKKRIDTVKFSKRVIYPRTNFEFYRCRVLKTYPRFSDNAYKIVNEFFTVTYSLLQIAVYLGFKEIYLLGCDCNYSGPKQHFADYGITVRNNPESNMIMAYTAAKQYADSHGIKIYNATRGGNLEVFERVDFDSLFPPEDSENNAPKTDK